ncbi:MAG: choice-of-anchor Q domain-containing protein [Chloroflexota bacterium]
MKKSQNFSQALILFRTNALLIFALAFLLAAVQPASAQGNTVGETIWYVSTTGNDANSCSATDAPCLTINGAIAKAVDGDTILVAVGTYTAASGEEVVLINKSVTLSGGWDEAFTAQSGMSTIDGQEVRRGITVTASVNVEYFIIQNGYDPNVGGGILNIGQLNLSNCSVIHNSAVNGGGIINGGALTVNNCSINSNTAGRTGWSGGGGGGISNDFQKTTTINNSTINGNTILGSFSGSAIRNMGIFTINNSIISNNTGISNDGTIFTSDGDGTATMTINNSTVSGNTSFFGGGIRQYHSTVLINNSTVTGNVSTFYSGGISSCPDGGCLGGVTIKNSIVAGNFSINDNAPDCLGEVVSAGYNLIGNKNGCTFNPAIGDQVGTNANPINPFLGPLQDNGGPTFTHALSGNSPALNAGNPATPGNGDSACLTTDQRGIVRPQGGVCDIGAYEGHFTAVSAISRLDPSPTSASSVNYLVTFSESVTGVDLVEPFSDFTLAVSGTTSATITSVSGSDDTYTVTVNTGSGNGNGAIRLKLFDDDSILDSSSNPLGGVGAGNGNFTTGEVYILRRVPTTISPTDTIIDKTPTYKWSKLGGATKYKYELAIGSTIIYTKIVPASVCGVSLCSNTPTTTLSAGTYKWRVRAMIGGVWKDFSSHKTFKLFPAKPGFWNNPGLEFYVINASPKVDNFAIYIRVNGCGNYKITHTLLATISNKQFSLTGNFYANGTFINLTTAQGTLGLSSFYIPGCGYVSGGPFPWTATWKNANQPDVMLNEGDILEFTVTPELITPFELFTIDPEK